MNLHCGNKQCAITRTQTLDFPVGGFPFTFSRFAIGIYDVCMDDGHNRGLTRSLESRRISKMHVFFYQFRRTTHSPFMRLGFTLLLWWDAWTRKIIPRASSSSSSLLTPLLLSIYCLAEAADDALDCLENKKPRKREIEKTNKQTNKQALTPQIDRNSCAVPVTKIENLLVATVPCGLNCRLCYITKTETSNQQLERQH
jgi:hypothetical protein